MPNRLEVEVRPTVAGRFGIYYRSDPAQLWTVYLSLKTRAEAEALAAQIRGQQKLSRVIDAPGAGSGPKYPGPAGMAGGSPPLKR